MTVEEMFNRISGEMTKANNEIADIINTYGNNMYHLGCIAGEQTAGADNKSELAKVLDAMYLNYTDTSRRRQPIQIVEFNADIIYSGAAEDVPKSILEKPYTIWSISVDTAPNSVMKIFMVA